MIKIKILQIKLRISQMITLHKTRHKLLILHPTNLRCKIYLIKITKPILVSQILQLRKIKHRNKTKQLTSLLKSILHLIILSKQIIQVQLTRQISQIILYKLIIQFQLTRQISQIILYKQIIQFQLTKQIAQIIFCKILRTLSKVKL